MRLMRLVLISLLLGECVLGANYPLKISSANPRILADQHDVPFLIVGDSPQSLIQNLTTPEAAAFLADRAAHGFNSLWVNVLSVKYTGGRADGTLWDGTKPFTNTLHGANTYDLTTPNEAYFAQVDAVIRMAATNGIVVMLDPMEPAGMLSWALANGSTGCRAYGQFLGRRYKNSANIIWLNGNDYQGWNVPTNDAVMTSVALGIKDEDSNHLQTIN